MITVVKFPFTHAFFVLLGFVFGLCVLCVGLEYLELSSQKASSGFALITVNKERIFIHNLNRWHHSEFSGFLDSCIYFCYCQTGFRDVY